MRKFLILAAAAGLYTIGTAAASAACLTTSHDANNNVEETIDLDCRGVVTPGMPSAQMRGRLSLKSDKRLAAEARVQAEITRMAQANPPAGTSPSLVSWLIGMMFGKDDAKPGPDMVVIDKGADGKAAGKDDDLFCLIELSGKGPMKQVGITVASNRKIKAKGLATVIIKGANDVSAASDVALNLKAGKSKSFPIVTTDALEGAAVSARLDIAGRQVICN